MSKHPLTNQLCMSITAAVLVITLLWMFSPQLGVTAASVHLPYVEQLFNTDVVHTIDIQMSDAEWQTMLANALNEEYVMANVVIDGTRVQGVGIRPKGNSSLNMIAKSDSQRFSLKVEFDHYSSKIDYLGLDKLVLNNIAQDNTYMKDYIAYQMMNAMQVNAPLSSFIWVTINGEDWGLYLAVEAVEESFAQRVYGNQEVEIYKPDNMDLNNVDRFQGNQIDGVTPPEGEQPFNMGGEAGQVPPTGVRPNMGEGGVMPQRPGKTGENIELPNMGEWPNMGQVPNPGEAFNPGQIGDRGGFGGMGGVAGATALIYTDDNLSSYSAIFENAAFKPSEADQKRLLSSLQQLNEQTNLDDVVDVEQVMRYFVVHNFVLNSDSYTGNLIHNYYLAEKSGQLSMIPWDYNLAFGGMGSGQNQATALVNYPVDTPLLSGTLEERPMLAWIFSDEDYVEAYHELYAEYVEYFNSGEFASMYEQAIALITPYVAKDPTAFATFASFEQASATLKEFCLLRAASIAKQLDGDIASTSEEQAATNQANFVDASTLDIASMGTNSMGFDRARR